MSIQMICFLLCSAGSSLPRRLLSGGGKGGLLSGGFPCCGARPQGCTGFSSCGTWTQELRFLDSGAHALLLRHTGSAAPQHVGSSREGSNPRLLHWQADSSSLSHQGSSSYVSFKRLHFKIIGPSHLGHHIYVYRVVNSIHLLPFSNVHGISNFSNLCPARGLSTSLAAQTVKRLSAMQETWVQSLGWEDLLEKEMAPLSSTLAWKILWMEEPGRLQSKGSQRVGHD